MADSGLMGCYGGGLVLCTTWHIRCNSASFTHLQLMWTTLHPLNLCKNFLWLCWRQIPKQWSLKILILIRTL